MSREGGPHLALEVLFFSVQNIQNQKLRSTPLFARRWILGEGVWALVTGRRPISAVGAVDTFVRSTRAVQTQFSQLRRTVLLASRCIPWAATPTCKFCEGYFCVRNFTFEGIECARRLVARMRRPGVLQLVMLALVVLVMRLLYVSRRIPGAEGAPGSDVAGRVAGITLPLVQHFHLSTQASPPLQRHSIWG